MNYKLDVEKLDSPQEVASLTESLSELAEQLDVLILDADPNGVVSARQGRIGQYGDQLWINTDGGTTWIRTDAGSLAKATGAEIDTGTNDVKYATPKAIKDSKLSYTDGAENLTNKIITSPDINGGTLDGVQIGGVTATGELIVNNSSDDAAGLGAQGSSGQILTSQGAGVNPTWTAVFSNYINGSTYIEMTNAAQRTISAASYTKYKELSSLCRGGNITLSWFMFSSSEHLYSKVYINGIAVGNQHDTTNTPPVSETITESNFFVEIGDVIQVYCYKAVGNDGYIKDLKILCLNPTTPQGVGGY